MATEMFEDLPVELYSLLSSVNDIVPEERNVPVAGIVHSSGMDDAKFRFVSLVLYEGLGVTVKVEHDIWKEQKWKEKAIVGKVIEVTCNVGIKMNGALPTLTSKQPPSVLSGDTVLTFIRSPVPTDEGENQMLCLEFVKRCGKKDDAKANSPDTFLCRMAQGESAYVKSWTSPALPHLKDMIPEKTYHIGPIKYAISYHDSKTYYHVYVNGSTVVSVYDDPLDDKELKTFHMVEDLNKCRTGEVIIFEGIALRQVVDQATHVTDRICAELVDAPFRHRVCVTGIPAGTLLQPGQGVKITAKVVIYDSVRLECLKFELDIQEMDKGEVLLPFRRYRPLIVSARTPSTPGGSRPSSQDPEASTPKRNVNPKKRKNDDEDDDTESF